MAKLTGHIRVAIFITVIYIRRTMVLVILANPFDAIMKTSPLTSLNSGGTIPSSVDAIPGGGVCCAYCAFITAGELNERSTLLMSRNDGKCPCKPPFLALTTSYYR